jgi:hypothetical protein
MRIAFVTSGLAPGKDGVGDYTRELAYECHTHGIRSCLLAINDRHVQQQVTEIQLSGDTSLDCLRLPATAPWEERSDAARAWLERTGPQCISLQFVNYGFHPKGLIGDLGRKLASVFAPRPVHLMLHEIWLGLDRCAPLRQRLIGRLQRASVLSMIRSVRPSLIHTSNPTYAEILRQQGLHPKLLPLCGNVPVTTDPDMHWLGEELERSGIPAMQAHSREHSWRFGLFGSVYETQALEPLFAHINEASRRAGRHVIIISAGRRGAGSDAWQELERRHSTHFSFAALGERPAHQISVFLQSVDFGIALTPWQLIGKSGSAAAMIEHGLPVIVPRAEELIAHVATAASETPLLHRMDRHTASWLLTAHRESPRMRRAEMAAQFIADIELAMSPSARRH